jgi:hypothetical protein
MSKLITWRSIEEKGLNNYQALTAPERVWYCVSCLTISARNGGLVSYYYNSHADHIEDLMTSLVTLGATDMLELMNRMNALFSRPIPIDLELLYEEIASWDDDVSKEAECERIGELEQAAASDLEQKLEMYSREHGIEV